MKKLIIFIIAIVSINIAYAQWTQLNSGTTKDLYSIFFVDSNTGYAVGDSGTIIKTTNKGNTWNKQNSESNNALVSIYFVNSNIGYVVGFNGTILKTTNGGNNWAAQLSGVTNPIFSVCFTDVNNGHAVNYFDTILKTTNGGNNWIKQKSIIDGDLHSIYFLDANTGFIAGNNNESLLMKTTNAGISWFRINTMTYNILNNIFFVNPNVCYIACYGGVIKSTNGGLNWDYQDLNSVIYSTFFIDINIGYAVGIDGNFDGVIYKTTNGGANWITQLYSIDNYIEKVVFTGQNIGYAVGSDGMILKTTNGGGSWIEERNKKESYKIYPNPISDQLTIETSQQIKECELIIVNLKGQELKRQQIFNNKTQIDISNLKKGVYFVKLITDKSVEVRKIIKE